MGRVGGFGFNPTLVRLRQVREVPLNTEARGFNPTLVRLRPPEPPYPPGTLMVSIPRWFD